MQAELGLRRAATGGIVLFLHLLIRLALLAAFRPSLYKQVSGEREIVITLPVRPEPHRASSQRPSEIAPPTLLVPEISPRAITPSISAPAPPARPAEPQGDIQALGRYLYNCTGAYYERLSARHVGIWSASG